MNVQLGFKRAGVVLVVVGLVFFFHIHKCGRCLDAVTLTSDLGTLKS